jgi:uncharacterized protein (TIGR02284 family)
MTTQSENQANIISNLISIHQDRISGYELESRETVEFALKRTFEQFAQQSREFVSVLSAEVKNLGVEIPKQGMSLSARLYRIWKDIKIAINGHDRQATIATCEHEENILLEAYEEALNTEGYLTNEIRILLLTQKRALVESNNTVKSLK